MANGWGGKRAGSGRKKGGQNPQTILLKEMILGALADVGGQKYLAARALDQPAAFMTLVGRVLPHTITGDGQQAITVEIVRFAAEEEGDGDEDSGD
jgi:hypothetical protein